MSKYCNYWHLNYITLNNSSVCAAQVREHLTCSLTLINSCAFEIGFLMTEDSGLNVLPKTGND